MASPNLSELITTTLRKRSGELADNVTNHNALLKRLNDRGNRLPATGRTIVMELDYASNSTAGFYSGRDVIDTSAQDVVTAAEFDWKQLAGTVVFDGSEMIKNSGREQVINLLAARMTNLERSLKNKIATSLYSNGTGDGGKEIDGLQKLVQDDPTSSEAVGGINQATYSFWQNKIYDFSDESISAGGTSDTILAAMNTLYLDCVRGADAPDFAVADSVYFLALLGALQANQRFGDASEAEAGFRMLKYLGMDVVYDDQCPASHMYMLNTDFLKLFYHPDRNFAPGETRQSVNQDAMVVPVWWAGNLCVSNRALQGVIVE